MQSLDTVLRERILAGILVAAGIVVVTLSLNELEIAALQTAEYVLALLFAAAVILANQYPIHLLRGTKLSLINVPIFLSTVLLPVSLAIVAVGAGLLAANLLTREERGLLARDIVATVGQWMFTVFWGCRVVHLTLPAFHGRGPQFGLLFACAALFILIDFVVFSISQSFVLLESFIPTLKSVIREGILIEATQYFIAILGTLAAYEVIWSLGLLLVPLAIAYIAFKNVKEMRDETIRILREMTETVDRRDMYTGGHSNRVSKLVQQTLVQLRVAGPEARLIEMSAKLHDIGKIGIPDAILKKPGPLSPEERKVMQTHSQKGAELITPYRDFSRGAAIIRHHHERWDGDGYPAGLKGYEIPFGSRVIAVVDSFDAMTSDRPYRRAVSAHQAIQTLLEGRDTQWEPAIVNAFVDMIVCQMDVELTKSPPQLEGASNLSQPAFVAS